MCLAWHKCHLFINGDCDEGDDGGGVDQEKLISMYGNKLDWKNLYT